MASSPRLQVSFHLTSGTYHRSAEPTSNPKLVVTTTFISPLNLVLELRGERDSGTILEERFRAELFEFFDLTTSLPVQHDLFPGTCNPRGSLSPRDVIELNSSSSLTTYRQVEDMIPLSVAVRQLEVGHEYRIRLKKQKIWGFEGTKQDLFRGKESVDVGELPEGVMISLESEDEVILKIEE